MKWNKKSHKAKHWRVKPLKVIALLMSFFVISVLLTNTGITHLQADDEPETLEEARARQEDLNRAQLEALREVDVVVAENEKISDAHNSATILVERQEREVAAARQSLELAEATYSAAQADLARSEEQLASYRVQIKEMAVAAYLEIQVNDDELILAAKDINEGVRKRAVIDLISTNTGDFLDELRLIEDENGVAQDVANQALQDIQASEQLLTQELQTLEADQLRLAELKVELEIRSDELEELIAEYEQESRDLEIFIQNKEAEERARALADSETYVWPTTGVLTGTFGERFHPILKRWRMHNGIDIAGNYDQPILAAHSGIVIVSTFDRGYGNYIVLEHGDGTASVYAHMSRRLVEVGAEVLVGQEIGHLGSSGLSTGPHLHFEIRLDGVPVDPIDYLPIR